MNKTKNSETADKLTVSAETLASMLDCGRATAVKIGTSAGAKIQIGRRVVFYVPKVQEYLKTISSDNSKTNEFEKGEF